MLEPWIIEQIRRREQEERRRNQPPRLEIPNHDGSGDQWRRRNEDGDPDDRDRAPRDPDEPARPADDQPERGVMIIDFGLG